MWEENVEIGNGVEFGVQTLKLCLPATGAWLHQNISANGRARKTLNIRLQVDSQ